jgi:hypothetical protein
MGAADEVGDAMKQSRGRWCAGDGEFQQPDGVVCEILWILGLQYAGLRSI